MAAIKTEKRNTLALFLIYALILSWAILFKLQFSPPVMEEGRVLNLIPFPGSFDGGGLMLSGETKANIFVFIPFGVYVCMLKPKWSFGRNILVIAAVSAAYETMQFIFAIGRADITDLLSNTLGGLMGVCLYALAHRLFKGRTDKIINGFAAVCTVLAVSLIALLLLLNR